MVSSVKKVGSRNALGRGLKALVSLVPAEQPIVTDITLKNGAKSMARESEAVISSSQITSSHIITSQMRSPQASTDLLDVDSENSPSRYTSSRSLELAGVVKIVKVEQVKPNLNQPRKLFNQDELKELTESIRAYGLLQPILVRYVGGNYEIVAGERRWRAAIEAGLKEIPVIVKELSEKETVEIALIENLQRSQLSPIEEARGYRYLMEQFDLTQEEVAEAVGKNRATVANSLRLLKLPLELMTLIENGKLPLGHAKVLLSVRDEIAQSNLAAKVVEDGLSVRELEQMVARAKVLESRETIPAGKRAHLSSPSIKSTPVYSAVTDRLRNALGTKVRIIVRDQGRGTIEIEYFSESELDGIVDKIVGSDWE